MIPANFSGTLNDVLIEKMCNKQLLIATNYNKNNIKQACYELTAGTIYYDATNGFKRINIKDEGYNYILLKPKQSVVIITKEELKMPANVIGRVLTKGKLFSIGLLPVNTYADPGFEGNLGIIFHNNSVNYLKITENEPIAKIEFSVLEQAVRSDYNGQHGYKTQIWPVPDGFKLSEKEFKSDERIGPPEDEISKIYGENYSGVIYRLLGVERKLMLVAITYLTFSLLIFSILLWRGKTSWFSDVWALVLGLLSNLMTAWIFVRLGKTKKLG